jgi:hypothetical protein
MKIVSMTFITMTLHNIQMQMSTNILKLFFSMFTSPYQIPRDKEIGYSFTAKVRPPTLTVGCAGRIRYTVRRKDERKVFSRVSMSRSCHVYLW